MNTEPQDTQQGSAADSAAKSDVGLFYQDEQNFLIEGETPLLKGDIHPAIFWKSVAVFVLAAILLKPAFNLAVFLALVGLFMFVLAFITHKCLVLLLTDMHVIVRSGIAFADLMQIRYSKIESVNIHVTLIGQLFGYGAVVIKGTGDRDVMVPFIRNASEFRNALQKRLIDEEKKQ